MEGVSASLKGALMERRAARWLQRRGLRPLRRNYRCRFGEIDLLALDGATLVFVEIRYRKSDRFGDAAASVDRRKRCRLIAAARHYLMSNPQHAERDCRFDVVALSARTPRWIRGAFDADL